MANPGRSRRGAWKKNHRGHSRNPYLRRTPFLVDALFTGVSLVRRDKLAIMTAGTYTFVPTRHGITVNALHCLIHATTLLPVFFCLKTMGF